MRAELGHDDADDEESEPPRALFWYPADYVLRTWRQNQKHDTFPNGGAYNDLDPLLDADWQRLTVRYNHIFEELRPRTDENGNRTSSGGRDPFADLDTDNASSWTEMMGD